MNDIIIEDNEWYKIMYNPKELYIYIKIEYNNNTSAGHPTNEGDDIVRTLMKIKEIEDKEPL